MFYDAKTKYSTMPKEIYVTVRGLRKLKEEYESLQNVKRKEIALRIQDAKELGDLSENAEYASAKEEQAQVESRISELRSMLRNAQVIKKDASGNSGAIQIGSKVKARFGDVDVEYSIVGSNEADPTNGLISNESPIGSALLGHRKGEKVNVATPDGEVEYEILTIE